LFIFGYSEWAATCKFATGMGTILVRSRNSCLL